MLEREACEHGVDAAIRHRQLLGTRTRVPRPAAAVTCLCDLWAAGVEPDHVDAGGGELPRHLTFAAPDVEHPTRAAQVLHHERDDLLLVLDVGAVGVLPCHHAAPVSQPPHDGPCSTSAFWSEPA